MKKRVIVSVTSDLVTDQRVHKVSETLFRNGYDVLLVGRKLPTSLPLEERIYATKRFRLLFTRTALFYMNYNLRLFFFLLFNKADILLANDLDTLPANYLVSRLKNLPLVYDSHEFYTGVPELQHRPRIRKIWESIEGFIFPRLRFIYTVNQSIASIYTKKYNKKIRVVRNLPYLTGTNIETVKPAGKKILIYQGAGINVNRGAEELVEAMQYLDADGYQLWIIGGGDVYKELIRISKALHVEDRIRFFGKLPFAKLAELTRQGDLGLSLDKNTNINYQLSLPNKIFDYLHAGLPILTSRLPEIARVTNTYDVGSFIKSHDPRDIAEAIRYMFENETRYRTWKTNTGKASRELNWQEEEKVILEVFAAINQG